MTINIANKYSELPNHIINSLTNKNIFVSIEYLTYLGKESNIYILYNKDYLIITELKKKIIFIYCEIISEIINLSKTQSSSKDFLDDVILVLKNTFQVQWISSTPNYSLFQDYPTKSLRIPFGSYIIDLQKNTQQVLLSNIHSKHRNSITRAERNGVEIRFGNDLIDDYLLLDSYTWARRGNVKNSTARKTLLNLLDNIPNLCFIGIAYKDNISQGGVFLLYNKYKCYYMYGASRDIPEPGSMNLLHWKCIQQMKEYSVSEYDFVGCRINEDENSKYHGIQNFKKRFGGELKTGFMFKVIINDFMYKLFKLLLYIKVGNNKDVIDQEIHKWQSINKS